MTLRFDLYFSFRSPYSYLATPQIEAMRQRYDVEVDVKVVRPIALRIPGFFKQVNPLWPPYLARDTFRIAQRLSIPYAWPRPDPVVMTLADGEVPAEQPYITPVSRLGEAAARAGRGFDFVREAARTIWCGEVRDWHLGDHLATAAKAAGLDLAKLQSAIDADPKGFDEAILANEAAQIAAGHWGVPLMVFENEPFFGQDRIEDLIWRMGQHGLTQRA